MTIMCIALLQKVAEHTESDLRILLFSKVMICKSNEV